MYSCLPWIEREREMEVRFYFIEIRLKLFFDSTKQICSEKNLLSIFFYFSSHNKLELSQTIKKSHFFHSLLNPSHFNADVIVMYFTLFKIPSKYPTLHKQRNLNVAYTNYNFCTSFTLYFIYFNINKQL